MVTHKRIDVSDDSKIADESIGMNPKKWIIHDGSVVLFKETTIRKIDNTTTYSDCAEVITHDICEVLGIPSAKYELATCDGKLGCISYNFLDFDVTNSGKKVNTEDLITGDIVIQELYPDFDSRVLRCKNSKELYTVDMIVNSLEKYNLQKDALKMILTDCITGNYDRNPTNWGIIKDRKNNECRLAPLYDNATTLGLALPSYYLDTLIDSSDGTISFKDSSAIKKFINESVTSKVVLPKELREAEHQRYLDAHIDEDPSTVHKYDYRKMPYGQLAKYIMTNYYDDISDFMVTVKENLTGDAMDGILNKFDPSELDDNHKFLTKSIVQERSESLLNMFTEVSYEKSMGKKNAASTMVSPTYILDNDIDFNQSITCTKPGLSHDSSIPSLRHYNLTRNMFASNYKIYIPFIKQNLLKVGRR